MSSSSLTYCVVLLHPVPIWNYEVVQYMLRSVDHIFSGSVAVAVYNVLSSVFSFNVTNIALYSIFFGDSACWPPEGRSSPVSISSSLFLTNASSMYQSFPRPFLMDVNLVDFPTHTLSLNTSPVVLRVFSNSLNIQKVRWLGGIRHYSIY